MFRMQLDLFDQLSQSEKRDVRQLLSDVKYCAPVWIYLLLTLGILYQIIWTRQKLLPNGT
jgi:hypothetical protein